MTSIKTYVNKLRGELEGRRLETQISGGAGEDEPEVDMDDVSVRVQQDIAVVPGGGRTRIDKGKGKLERIAHFRIRPSLSPPTLARGTDLPTPHPPRITCL